MKSPTRLPMRMNAAETSASRAIADWTPLTVVPRSRTTAEIDTFINDVSTTRTNIAIANRMPSRRSLGPNSAGAAPVGPLGSSPGDGLWTSDGMSSTGPSANPGEDRGHPCDEFHGYLSSLWVAGSGSETSQRRDERAVAGVSSSSSTTASAAPIGSATSATWPFGRRGDSGMPVGARESPDAGDTRSDDSVSPPLGEAVPGAGRQTSVSHRVDRRTPFKGQLSWTSGTSSGSWCGASSSSPT